MPSPIAHSISGYAIARLPFTRPRHLPPLPPLVSTYAVFIACCPDLDFLPQLLTGFRFHRGPSHSLFAALLVSSFLAWLLHRYRRTISSALSKLSYREIFLFTLWLYTSHLVLDLLTYGGSGIPLFWPLITQNVQLPFALFPAVHHSRGLLDPSHLIFIGAELLYSVAVVISLRLLTAASSNASDKQRSQDV